VCINIASRARDGDPRFAPVALAILALSAHATSSGSMCGDIAQRGLPKVGRAEIDSSLAGSAYLVSRYAFGQPGRKKDFVTNVERGMRWTLMAPQDERCCRGRRSRVVPAPPI
jgi:hypothetical protein